MNILIVEDEVLTAQEIKKMLTELAPDFNIVGIKSSVEEVVDFFKHGHAEIKLILMDIQLSDGSCFEIFEQVELNCPVIFITAYNEYVLKAFKTNSVDYLLKPLKKEELMQSIAKFKRIFREPVVNSDYYKKLITSLNQVTESNYITRILVSRKDSIIPLEVNEISLFYSENKIVKVFSRSNQIFTISKTLEQLEKILSPDCFFRINRQSIISIHAIKEVKKRFNRILHVIPLNDTNLEIVVSVRKQRPFLEWLNNVKH